MKDLLVCNNDFCSTGDTLVGAKASEFIEGGYTHTTHLEDGERMTHEATVSGDMVFIGLEVKNICDLENTVGSEAEVVDLYNEMGGPSGLWRLIVAGRKGRRNVGWVNWAEVDRSQAAIALSIDGMPVTSIQFNEFYESLKKDMEDRIRQDLSGREERVRDVEAAVLEKAEEIVRSKLSGLVDSCEALKDVADELVESTSGETIFCDMYDLEEGSKREIYTNMPPLRVLKKRAEDVGYSGRYAKITITAEDDVEEWLGN